MFLKETGMKMRGMTVLATVAILVAGVTLAAASAATPAAAGTDARPTIFVCGDSTSKYSGSETATSELQGWGTPIAKFFDAEKVKVSNMGHAGASSRSYFAGDWPRVIAQVKKGDYVLIVFGINDGTTMDGIGDETRAGRGPAAGGGTPRGARRGPASAAAPDATAASQAATSPAAASAPAQPVEHTYGWYMRTMATETRAKGAHPYFLTVTTRNIWRNPNPNVKYANNGVVIGELPADYDPKLDQIERGTANAKYTNYTKQVGEMIHVPVFDLTNACADVYEKMGRVETSKFYKDHNHTFAAGAENVATVIATGLKGFKDSPFVPLMNEKGRALPMPNPKYVLDNPAPAAGK
jgi:lysophospholipase L1-like esterase